MAGFAPIGDPVWRSLAVSRLSAYEKETGKADKTLASQLCLNQSIQMRLGAADGRSLPRDELLISDRIHYFRCEYTHQVFVDIELKLELFNIFNLPRNHDSALHNIRWQLISSVR